MVSFDATLSHFVPVILTFARMNRRKADFKFVYKYLEDDL